jgi:acetyl esterase/lipase
MIDQDTQANGHDNSERRCFRNGPRFSREDARIDTGFGPMPAVGRWQTLRAASFGLAVVLLVTQNLPAQVPVRNARPIAPQSFAGEYPRVDGVFLFDMGTAESPVKNGFQKVVPADVYSKDKGYGFATAPGKAEHLTEDIVSQSELTPMPTPVRAAIYGVDDLTCDYVADKKIAFKLDVPPGRYDVIVNLGHMLPAFHVFARINGQEVLRDTDIFTYHHYRRGHRDDGAFGGWHKIWAVTDAPHGQITIEAYGDETAGKRSFEMVTYEDLRQEVIERGTYSHAGPFREVGLMGVVVVPHTDAPFEFAGDKLHASEGCPTELAAAAEAFNAGELAQAKKRLAAMEAPQLQMGRGMVYMALAGSPRLDEDWEMLDAAQAAFRAAIEADPRNYTARVLLSQCEQFFAGINLFVDRRNVAGTEISATGRFHRVHMLHRQFPPDHPFYLKALVYRGRMFRALVPFVKCAKSWEGLWALEEVEKKYPDNRYVRLFLHDQWSTQDWPLNDYPSPMGTPAWADGLRRAFGQGIDFGNWWAANGQADNGALGGGWTDDVEVMPFWGLLSLIDPSAMPACMTMLDKFTAGIWDSGVLDRDRVFEIAFADAEHSAEPSGDGINYLVGVKYGHPLWVERNMLHAKLNKNVLTGINPRGWRLYRSGDMSASRYAANHEPADQPYQNEDAICLRAWRSVPWLVWYNANPTARKVLLEKADACYHVAMGTEEGKPKGVIPNAVMWDGRPGGHQNGHGSRQGAGADNGGYSGKWYLGGFEGEWPGIYMSHYVNLMLSAYVASSDAKYLEPFRAQYEYVRSVSPGFDVPVADGAAKGSDAWVASKLLGDKGGLITGLLQIRLLTGDKGFDDLLLKRATGYAKYRLTGDKRAVAESTSGMADWIRKRWPHMTTEASQTDRIAYYPEMVSFYVGADAMGVFQGLPLMAVTYANAGKDFAGLVERASLKDLKLHLYSFHAEPRTLGLRPWLLEAGGEYNLRYGVDRDDDGTIDQLLSERRFTLEARGSQLDIDIPPGEVVVVEVAQVKAPAAGPMNNTPADLAVCDEDIRVADDEHLGQLELDIRVHNIGGSEANDVVVETYLQKPGGQPELVERGILSGIDAPLALDPQSTRMGVWLGEKKLADGDTVTVRVDPQNTIHEINEQNNAAQRVVHLTAKQAEALNEVKAAPETAPSPGRGRERGRAPAEAAPRERTSGNRSEARRGQDAPDRTVSPPAPAERRQARSEDSPAAKTSGKEDASRRAELAKWDAADSHRSQTGPGGTEWDGQYRSFIQSNENAASKGFPTHADAARQIKEDAAKSPEALAKHLGWVLFIKHFSQAYRPEEATADLKCLYEDLVSMKMGGGSGPESLPFDGDPRLVIHRDVVYGKTHPEIQKLDAYLVKSDKPTPVVIEIHGGGWRRGSKSQFVYQGNLIGAILDAGISVVAIDYRLTPQHTMPAQLEDAVRAVQFVRSMAKTWNLDPDRIAALGGSAGAHLAAWVALHDDIAKADSADPVERCSSRLSCFVPLSGPMDLTRVRPTELASQPLRGQDFANAFTAAFGCTAEQFEQDPAVRQRIRDASPLFLVSGDDPPAFVMGPWNDQQAVLRDPPVPAVINDPHSIWHGVLLAEALRKAGVSVEIRIGPEVGKDPGADNTALVAFLRHRFLAPEDDP